MSQEIGRAEIPSASSGELYEIRAYDDGTLTCSCPYGRRRGPMTLVGPNCKHVRQYDAYKETGSYDSLIPSALTDQELGFDRAMWVRQLCAIFSPYIHLQEVVAATIERDNYEIKQFHKKESGDPQYRRLRPKPLPAFQRAVLQCVYRALQQFEPPSGTQRRSNGSDANQMAEDILREALVLREQSRRVELDTNKDIAFRLHRKLYGE